MRGPGLVPLTLPSASGPYDKSGNHYQDDQAKGGEQVFLHMGHSIVTPFSYPSPW